MPCLCHIWTTGPYVPSIEEQVTGDMLTPSHFGPLVNFEISMQLGVLAHSLPIGKNPLVEGVPRSSQILVWEFYLCAVVIYPLKMSASADFSRKTCHVCVK